MSRGRQATEVVQRERGGSRGRQSERSRPAAHSGDSVPGMGKADMQSRSELCEAQRSKSDRSLPMSVRRSARQRALDRSQDRFRAPSFNRSCAVAFFMKQMGRNPSRNGEIFRLKDRHGGEWDEWHDLGLRLREFPQAFYDYRKDEMKPSAKLRPFTKEKKSKKVEDESITPEEKADFKRLDQIVKKGINAFWEVGRALAVIKAGKLWKVGGHQGWDAYCRSVAGMSRAHAHRLVDATGFMDELKTLPHGNVLPQMEAQIRPLLRIALRQVESHREGERDGKSVLVGRLAPETAYSVLACATNRVGTSYSEVRTFTTQPGRHP